jgi:flagellin-like hook-associated protein FlgL
MMNSVNTNPGAMAALQNLNKSNMELQERAEPYQYRP